MNRLLIALSAAVAASIALLWLLPPVGFIACLVLLILIPPYGRTLVERATISGIVLLGAIAIAYPRAGSTPVDGTSARLALTGLVIVMLALRAIRPLRNVPIPKPTWADVATGALVLVSGLWLMGAYIGRNTYEIVSGLFYSGWDNQGHFTTFANTYVVGSTTWPTLDGTTAWNQWYPSLHTTTWALAEYAMNPAAALDRPGLLWPFVLWSAISFALCLGALSYVAGDIAARFLSRDGKSKVDLGRVLAIGAFALFALFGSPQYLFNKGFTNFMMGVTTVVVVSYFSARSWRSARRLGWFLIPLGGLVIIGLWTPLALGLIPAGIVVVIALWAQNRWLGIGWLLVVAAGAAVLALTQSQAIMGVEKGQSTADFTTSLGAVGTGMAQFNIGAALLTPVVIGLFVVILIRRHHYPMPYAIAGPVLGALIIALIFVFAADAAKVGRLQSYYVLKALDAALLSTAPVIAALGAIVLVLVTAEMRRATAVLTIALAGVIVVSMFGYIGARPDRISETYISAPGIQAAVDRTQGINSPLVGEAIIRARDAAVPYPDYTTLLWDGAGTLPNLWVSSLSGVMSRQQNAFYQKLPQFPYDNKTAEYVTLAMNLNANLRVAVLWFRTPSGDLLKEYVANRGDDRVVLVHVPMPPSPLCEECTL